MARSWLPIAGVLVGCQPYVAVGYDTTSRVHGALAGVVSQPIAAARTAAPLADPAAPTPVSGNSYSLAVGGGVKNFTIELGLHAHELGQGSLALPDPATDAGTPRYVTSSTSLDLRCTFVRYSYFSLNLHAGPAVGAIVDRTTGSTSFAEGFRYGGTIEATVAMLTAYVDLYSSGFEFSSGPAAGFFGLDGLTVGLMVR